MSIVGGGMGTSVGLGMPGAVSFGPSVGGTSGGRNVAIRTGMEAGSATAAQFQDRPCSFVNFKAKADNSGNVYIGVNSAVAVAGAATSDVVGWELDAGQETGLLPCTNTSNFYKICDNAGDDILFLMII
jgi:hypothetical protein